MKPLNQDTIDRYADAVSRMTPAGKAALVELARIAILNRHHLFLRDVEGITEATDRANEHLWNEGEIGFETYC